MKKLLILIGVFLLSIACINQAHAQAKAYVDRNEIGQNETFELSIELSEPASGQPDLSNFPKEIEILRSSNFHHSSIINGTATISSGWRIRMKATKAGVFTLPAVSIGAYETKPIQIKVLPASNSITLQGGNENPSIFIEVSLDKDTVVPQEQLLYTILIYSSVPTQYRTLTEPSIDDAMVESIGDLPGYEKYINGTRYSVIPRKYAIFPQKEGVLTVPPVTFSAEVPQGRQSRSIFGSFNSRAKPVSVTSETLTAQVKSKPAQAAGWWLPASSLNLSSQWSNNIQEFVVGEPATLEITLVAEGNSQTQLPEIKLEKVEGLKWYVDNSNVDQKATANKGLIASRTERYAIVPTQEGKLTIPAIEIPWYNTQTASMEIARINAREINVKPATNSTFQPLTKNILHPQEIITETVYDAGYWPWATLAISLIWMATMFWLVKLKRSIHLRPHAHESNFEPKEIKISRLESICKCNDPQRIHRELLDWCSFHLSQYNIHSLHGLGKLVKSEAFKHALSELESMVYGKNSSDKTPDLVPFLKELQELAKNQNPAKRNSQLPPLYQSQ